MKRIWRNVLIVSIAVCGCAANITRDRDYQNLSYDEFKTKVGIDGFDPQGASDISYRLLQTTDSYAIWMKLRVPVAAYHRLADQFTRDLENPDFVAQSSAKPIGPVRKTTSKEPDIPKHWPKSESDGPSWWNVPPQDRGLEVVTWEVQLNSGDRAKGWYWVYDVKRETLWIWEWNRQWWRLGFPCC